MADKARYKIGLSRFIREQLAEMVRHLPDFDLTQASHQFILQNKKSWASASRPSLIATWKEKAIIQLQQSLGLINYKKHTDPEADVIFTNGGFLGTDKPYIVYIEKPTEIFGYTANNYGKPLAKYMLRRFLRDEQLKTVFFMTQTALQGMLNTKEFGPEILELIKQKGQACYPPLENPQASDLKRFATPKVMKFLFVSSIFYEKGGKELLAAFDRLSRDLTNVELHIVTKVNKLTPEDTALINKNKAIVLADAAFSRDELFDQFFNQCHAFVYPTYSDSFSAVINEAIAADLPIITSDFYSIPERVSDGRNGFLFPSPWPNYDKDMVIRAEHFKPDSAFPRQLPEWQAAGKLRYVEDFLYTSMHKLATDASLRQSMAQASRELYETELSPQKIRDTINRHCLAALTDKSGE